MPIEENGPINVSVNGLRYAVSMDKKTASLIALPKQKYAGNITVPKSITFNGNTYQVTGISAGAFKNCTSITSITIPACVNQIDETAFIGCSTLSSIQVEDGNATYDSRGDCNAIIETSTNRLILGCQNTIIPNNISRIGNNAFNGCKNMSSVTLPKTIQSIGSSAFAYCTGIKDFYIYSANMPTIESDAFNGVQIQNIVLHVPAELITEYKSAAPWNGFKKVVALPQLVYYIDGEIYKSYTLYIGEEIIPEAGPQKEGYTFSGWSEIPGTMPANDVKISGTFTANKYTLTYILDGETYSTESITYGTNITPKMPSKEGFTFSGWDGLPTTMPAHNVTVTGSFVINQYTITYMVNGEVVKQNSQDYKSAITPPAAPSKEGYTFSGWNNVPETMPAHDVTVTGAFVINQYTISFIIDGETIGQRTQDYNTAISAPTPPTKEGYTFSGWVELPETMPAHDVVVTGSYSINSYQITYIVDGEIYKKEILPYGSAIVQPESPTKEGYIFSGWNEVPETMPAHDVTITASFTKGAFVMTYIVDGQTYKTYGYDYQQSIDPEKAPSKEGYTFSGWSEIPETMPAHNVTVTGTFTINQYTIRFTVDGEEISSVTQDYQTEVTPPEIPEREGYSFAWENLPEVVPPHDVTVTGIFKAKQYTITYLVNSETYSSAVVDYGSTIVPPVVLEKTGSTFAWGEYPETMPAHDITITGTFTINQYTIKFVVDGEEVSSVTQDYQTTITAPEIPEREGYTLVWENLQETVPAHDVTITGTFKVNQYTITYIVDGETYTTDIVDYGSTIVPPVIPGKVGSSFAWGEYPETMPAEDVTVNGTFTINSYKLTYMIGDEFYKETTVEYGATITAEPKPEGDYQTFEWVDLPETMPAHDVVVHASFTTDIDTMMSTQRNMRIYSPNGKRLNSMHQGLNIVIFDDGTVHKIFK